MNHSKKNPLPIGVALAVALSFWCACQSDTPAASASQGADSATTEQAAQPAATLPADPAKMYADARARIQELEQKFAQFAGQLKALQRQIDAVPTAAKKAAVDYPELTAQMEGYSEKGAYYQDILQQAAQTLKATGAPGGEGSPDAEGDWYRQLQEAAEGWEGFQSAIPSLEKAVERLKTGGGKPVRLFE
ncbi:MAG: hypothetical protein JNK89_10075 [Saprospiraceae bacterium]|nr:hypothetical protein [Saprospiraceae bacterium]